MAEISLFEHNELAFDKLNEALASGNCATINHATGTGKSFIALKYLYENRDKKYLYLAPTYQILDQLIEDAKKIGINPNELNIDRLIYVNLLDMDMKELFSKYDGIIFDEYHRCGAKETFYKIKELKALLNRAPSDKKFIGLTATPIRYLDNERNMTNEIFDGVVASNLTLANAMCDELLPIPNYYISAGAIVTEIEKLIRRINDLPESTTKAKLIQEINMINFEQTHTSATSELFSKYLNQKQGKYIVFCRDIESLSVLRQNIHTWFKDIKQDSIFEVHSNMSDRSKNRNLKEFNDIKEGFNILLCVDVLNEGVHIDDVDGVILNRRTSSPIIYFQQIGRALSFSGRNREIQIYDLKYNYGNHEAIYEVYDEFKEELKRRMKLDPKNKDKYIKMSEKFRIMDESKEMLERIHKISSKLNEESIITAKIENAILCVERYRKENHVVDDIFIENICDEELIQAYYTLEKYQKYVTNAQFLKLQKLQFVMPPGLLTTYEERKAMLGKYNSVHEKEKDEALLVINEIQKFIETNQRTPDENSDDLIERSYFELYKQCLLNLGLRNLAKISSLITSLNIKITPWEKVLLQVKPTNEEVNVLLKDAVQIVNSKAPLPKHIYKAINLLIIKYDFKEQDKIVKLLKMSDRLDILQKKHLKEKQDEIIASINEEFFGDEAPKKDEITDHINKLIEELDKPYLILFKKKFNKQKKLFIKKSIRLNNETPIHQFSQDIIRKPAEDIPKLIKTLIVDLETIQKLKNVYEFMKSHDERLPSQYIPEEKPLYDIINAAIKEGVFTDKILRMNMFRTNTDGIASSLEIVKELTDNAEKNSLLKLMIAKQIMFVKINNRKPIELSPNPDERQIAHNYATYVIGNAPDNAIMILSTFLNKNIYLRNTFKMRQEFLEMQQQAKEKETTDKDEI